MTALIKNPYPVAILLGTYNASAYLEKMISSLMSQTYKQWTLYIRDDESTDDTKRIICKCTQTYNNIIYIEDSKGNLGTKNNFQELLYRVDSEYYMFCDHDDVWLPFKIELTLGEMKRAEIHSANSSVLVHTDLKVVDSELNTITESFWESSKIQPSILSKFEYLMTYNLVTGCTMMINQKAKEISLPIPKEATMHDSWIALRVAHAGGALKSISKKTILYRQHPNNVIGAKNYEKNYIISKILNFKRVIEDNLLSYRMANKIQKTSVLDYLFYKILYLCRR